MDSENYLKLPAIKGIIGNWIYYQTSIPFYEAVRRIDNDHSIREYNSLDDVLQRDLSKRSKLIAQYLVREETRFFNSAIVGLFGGAPSWYNFDFSPSAIPGMDLSEYILNSIGLLELAGDEKLFSIDGQHRIDGIKQALEIDYEKFKYDELPIIIVAHTDDKEGKVRTRRLFSEINTKAVKVGGLDDLITNEDNPIDINARRLFAEFELFEGEKYIALNKTANIDAESQQFTSIINLKEVNKILYSAGYTHQNFRPSNEILDDLFNQSKEFWTNALENIPLYHSIFYENHLISDYRSKDGGSMLLRPIGIKVLADAYSIWGTNHESYEEFWLKFDRIDDDLNGEYWKDILWDNAKKNIKAKTSEKFLREYCKYLLEVPHDVNYLLEEYNKAKGIEENNPEKLALPPIPANE